MLKALWMISSAAHTQILSLCGKVHVPKLCLVLPFCAMGSSSLCGLLSVYELICRRRKLSECTLYPLNSFLLCLCLSLHSNLSSLFPLLFQGLVLPSLSWADPETQHYPLLIKQNNPFIQKMFWSDYFVSSPILDTGEMAVNETDVNP